MPGPMLDRLFSLSPAIRYVAIYRSGDLETRVRPSDNASGADSDRYEEILVNPTLLLLARQRGDIDCGGLEFLLVRYGNFYQYVQEIVGGHVSICIEPSADPLDLVGPIRSIVGTSAASGSHDVA